MFRLGPMPLSKEASYSTSPMKVLVARSGIGGHVRPLHPGGRPGPRASGGGRPPRRRDSRPVPSVEDDDRSYGSSGETLQPRCPDERGLSCDQEAKRIPLSVEALSSPCGLSRRRAITAALGISIDPPVLSWSGLSGSGVHRPAIEPNRSHLGCHGPGARSRMRGRWRNFQG